MPKVSGKQQKKLWKEEGKMANHGEPLNFSQIARLCWQIFMLPVRIIAWVNKKIAPGIPLSGLSLYIALFVIDCLLGLPFILFSASGNPDFFLTEAVSLFTIYPIFVFAAIAYGNRSLKERHRKSPLGQQRFANLIDAKNADLVNSQPDMVLGLMDKQIIGPQESDWHSILIGGQGSGKTTCGIIPTLLSFPGSAVVFDIKGELYNATAEQRRQYGNVIVINPTKADTWRYNPLSACDPTPEGIIECQEFGRSLIPDPPGGAGQNQWVIDGARALTSALAYISAVEDGTIFDLVMRMTSAETRRDEEGKIIPGHEVIAESISESDETARLFGGGFVSSDQKTRGYYISNASDFLRTFALDFEIRNCTTPLPGKTFTFDMLEEGTTVYLQIPEAKLKQSADLWRLIFMQLLRHLQARGERKQPHILVCLDEFPQLGKMDQLPEMLATLRSRNVHVMLAGQSIADIDEKYKDVTRRRIIDNCNYISIFNSTDPQGQKYFSDMIGQQTIITRSGGRGSNSSDSGSGGRNQSQNWQESGQPLIRPEDLRNLGNNVIVIARETWPMKLEKAFFKNLKTLV